MSANPLTWALVVATYVREDVLPRCLRLGAAQTRPPLEIIIVDSSPGWESTRERVLREVALRRDEQREYLAAKALMEREITADRDHLVVGMGSHYYYAPLFNCTELDRHAVRDAVNSAKKTACRALKDAVEEMGCCILKLCRSGQRVAMLGGSSDLRIGVG
jgi:hypothetical protein